MELTSADFSYKINYSLFYLNVDEEIFTSKRKAARTNEDEYARLYCNAFRSSLLVVGTKGSVNN